MIGNESIFELFLKLIGLAFKVFVLFFDFIFLLFQEPDWGCFVSKGFKLAWTGGVFGFDQIVFIGRQG